MNGRDFRSHLLHWVLSAGNVQCFVFSSEVFFVNLKITQLILKILFSSLSKYAEQLRNSLRDLNRHPSSASRSLSPEGLLHCGVLDLPDPDYLRLCAGHNICHLRDCVSEP